MKRARFARMLSTLTMLGVAAALPACNSGGGGDGFTTDAGALPAAGGNVTPPPAPPPQQASVVVGWGPATGPVTGYRLFVSRDGGPFAVYSNVGSNQARVGGDEGQRVRVQVAAFDAQNNLGPPSLPSDEFVMPAATSAAVAANAAPVSNFSLSAPAAGAAPGSPGADVPAKIVLPGEKTARDFSGDGVSDLLWQTDSGEALRITSVDLETQLLFTRPGAGWMLAGAADFDGDGLTDLLWESDNGDLGLTPTADLAENPPETPLVLLGALADGETVAGTGDFDGDGQGDVLVGGSAGHSVWLMNPGALPDVVPLASIEAGYAPADLADFDGDGNHDILWRNEAGDLSIWLMAGALAHDHLAVAGRASAAVLGSGDFDGDGADEVALHDAETGAVTILDPGAGAAESLSGSSDATGLVSVGSGDFDGDGTGDLLWSTESALRVDYLPGEEMLALDPDAPWQLLGALR